MAKIVYGYSGKEEFGDGTVRDFGGLDALTDAGTPSGDLLRALALCGFALALIFQPRVLGFQHVFGKPRRRRSRGR